MTETSSRTALITGASKGLGYAIADRLARRGTRLVLDARTPAELDAATARLIDRTDTVSVVGDITDPRHRKEIVAATKGRLDLLVLNASALGPTPLPPLAAADLDAFRGVLETNTVAALALVQLLLPELRAANGTVVFISSDAATTGYEGWGLYGASKAAADQLARVLAAEEPEIRVYAVDPGDMNTEMHAAADPETDPADLLDPAVAAMRLEPLLTGSLPSGRYAGGELR
ncbi:SDR family oxidoreductase [Fodinicola acaciae]|uniref:SDR family oxidoreductase n=1 Tax=Fodinicola acaciae TaxID=2681555 RepID=UPI0013D668BB|nr:SDR family oxidoreductase [Fodinicola acaciae]